MGALRKPTKNTLSELRAESVCLSEQDTSVHATVNRPIHEAAEPRRRNSPAKGKRQRKHAMSRQNASAFRQALQRRLFAMKPAPSALFTRRSKAARRQRSRSLH